MYPRLSATLTCRGASPEPGHRRPSFTRSGSVRRPDREASPEPNDKPSGKRKFKSKHLSDTDEPKKVGSSAASIAEAIGLDFVFPAKQILVVRYSVL